MRVLKICVVFVVLCSCMATTAHAVDNESSWTQVLDFATVNNSGDNYFVVNNSGRIFYDLPQRTYCVWIDMLVNTSDNPITSAYSIWQGSKTQLTVSPVGDNLCRIYGRMSYHTYSQLILEINCSGTGYYEVLSCKVSNLLYNSFSVRGKMQVTSGETVTVEQADAGTSCFANITNEYASWEAMVWSAENWKLYDTLSFTFCVRSGSVSSITAQHDNKFVPVTVSPIIDGDGGYSNGSIWRFEVTIDLSGLDRTSNKIPYIYLSGESDTDYSQYIQLLRTTGYVESDTPDLLKVYFDRLFATLIDLFGDDAGSSAGFQEEAGQQRDELDDMNQQLENVTKPPVDGIQMDVNDYIDSGDTRALSIALAGLTGDSLMIRMMCIVLTIALVGYVLYGKR